MVRIIVSSAIKVIGELQRLHYAMDTGIEIVMRRVGMSKTVRCAICGRFVSGEFGIMITPDSEFTCEQFEYYCDEHAPQECFI